MRKSFIITYNKNIFSTHSFQVDEKYLVSKFLQKKNKAKIPAENSG